MPSSAALFEGSLKFCLTLTPGLRPGLHSAAIFDGSLSDFFLVEQEPAQFCSFPFSFFLFPLPSRRATTKTIQSFCTQASVTRRLRVPRVIIAMTIQLSQSFPVTKTALDVT